VRTDQNLQIALRHSRPSSRSSHRTSPLPASPGGYVTFEIKPVSPSLPLNAPPHLSPTLSQGATASSVQVTESILSLSEGGVAAGPLSSPSPPPGTAMGSSSSYIPIYPYPGGIGIATTSPSPSPSPMAGSVLHGRYVTQAGSAHQSGPSVLAGTDTFTNRPVALKRARDRESFEVEIAALRSLQSEFVVTMYDCFTQAAPPQLSYIVLELGDHSLSDLIPTETFHDFEKKFIVNSISHGLEYLHRHGFVHGDLKPANVVRFQGKWKLVDFNTCRKFGAPMASMLSPVYAPPEIMMALGNSHARMPIATSSTDMWGLGLILYELARRQLLIPNASVAFRDISEILAQRLNPKDFQDEQLFHLLLKLLSSEPNRRPSASAVLRHAYLNGGLDTEQYRNILS